MGTINTLKTYLSYVTEYRYPMRLNIDRNQITVEDMGQHGMPKNFTNTTCRSYAITIAFTFQLACPVPTINRKISQLSIEIIARSIMIICNQIAQREIIFSTRKYFI